MVQKAQASPYDYFRRNSFLRIDTLVAKGTISLLPIIDPFCPFPIYLFVHRLLPSSVPKIKDKTKDEIPIEKEDLPMGPSTKDKQPYNRTQTEWDHTRHNVQSSQGGKRKEGKKKDGIAFKIRSSQTANHIPPVPELAIPFECHVIHLERGLLFCVRLNIFLVGFGGLLSNTRLRKKVD